MNYYPQTITTLRSKIRSTFPEAKAIEASPSMIDAWRPGLGHASDLPIMENVLWMFDQMAGWTVGKSAKAGRWIGWINLVMGLSGLITHAELRDMIRTDVQAGDE